MISSKKNAGLRLTDNYIYLELEQLNCSSSVWTLGSRFVKSIMSSSHKRSDRLIALGLLRKGSTLQLMNNDFGGSNSIGIEFVPLDGNGSEEWLGQINLVESSWQLGVGVPSSVFGEIVNLLEKDALGPVEMSLEIKELHIAQVGQFFIKPENEASPDWSYVSVNSFNWQQKTRFIKQQTIR